MNTNAFKQKLLNKFFVHHQINPEYIYQVLEEIFQEKETLAVSLIDSQGDMTVYSFSKLSVNMDILSEANNEILKLITKTMQGELEDIIYYESNEVHFFKPIKLGGRRIFFLYFIGMKEKTNFVLLRNKMSKFSHDLETLNGKER
jgi:hypothetical protein